MTTLPSPGYISHPDRTEGEGKQYFEDLRSVIAELLGGAAESELTIAAGSVTPTGAAHSIDTEGDAASDDLTNIDVTNHPEGRLLLIRGEDAARVVTAKHLAGGSGEISFVAGADVALTTSAYLFLIRRGTVWHEVLSLPAGAGGGGTGHTKIINPGFNLAQRGTQFKSTTPIPNNDKTYTLDRWKLLSDGNNIVDVMQNTANRPAGSAACAQLIVNAANTKCGLVQILENADSLAVVGSSASVSFKARIAAGTTALNAVRMALLAWSGTADQPGDIIQSWGAAGTNPTLGTSWAYTNTPIDIALTTAWQTFTMNDIAIPGSATNVALFFWIDGATATNDELLISAMQLNEGSAAAGYFEPKFGEELLRAQRYYFTMVYNPGFTSSERSGNFEYPINHPTTMRVIPTYTDDFQSPVNCTVLGMLVISEQMGKLRVNLASPNVYSPGSGTITGDAEL